MESSLEAQCKELFEREHNLESIHDSCFQKWKQNVSKQTSSTLEDVDDEDETEISSSPFITIKDQQNFDQFFVTQILLFIQSICMPSSTFPFATQQKLLQKTIQLLVYFIEPHLYLTKEYLSIISSTSLVAIKPILIEHVPQIIGTTKEEVNLVIQLFGELLSEDRSLLPRIIAALFEIELSPAQRLQVSATIIEMLDIVQEEDMPTVVRTLLRVVTAQNALQIIEAIRNQSIYLTEKYILVLLEIFSNAFVANEHVANAFLKCISMQRSSQVHSFDVIILIIILKFPKRRTEVFKILQLIYSSGSLSFETLSAALLQSHLLQKDFSQSIYTLLVYLFHQKEVFTFSLTTSKKFEKYWCVSLFVECFKKYPTLQHQLLQFLIANFEKSNPNHEFAATILSNISVQNDEFQESNLTILEDALYNAEDYSILAIQTICSSICSSCQYFGNIKLIQSIMILIRKYLFSGLDSLTCIGIIAANAICKNTNLMLEKEDKETILEWMFQVFERPNNVDELLVYVLDFFATNAKGFGITAQIRILQDYFIALLQQWQCFVPFVEFQMNPLQKPMIHFSKQKSKIANVFPSVTKYYLQFDTLEANSDQQTHFAILDSCIVVYRLLESFFILLHSMNLHSLHSTAQLFFSYGIKTDSSIFNLFHSFVTIHSIVRNWKSLIEEESSIWLLLLKAMLLRIWITEHSSSEEKCKEILFELFQFELNDLKQTWLQITTFLTDGIIEEETMELSIKELIQQFGESMIIKIEHALCASMLEQLFKVNQWNEHQWNHPFVYSLFENDNMTSNHSLLLQCMEPFFLETIVKRLNYFYQHKEEMDDIRLQLISCLHCILFLLFQKESILMEWKPNVSHFLQKLIVEKSNYMNFNFAVMIVCTMFLIDSTTIPKLAFSIMKQNLPLITHLESIYKQQFSLHICKILEWNCLQQWLEYKKNEDTTTNEFLESAMRKINPIVTVLLLQNVLDIKQWKKQSQVDLLSKKWICIAPLLQLSVNKGNTYLKMILFTLMELIEMAEEQEQQMEEAQLKKKKKKKKNSTIIIERGEHSIWKVFSYEHFSCLLQTIQNIVMEYIQNYEEKPSVVLGQEQSHISFASLEQTIEILIAILIIYYKCLPFAQLSQKCHGFMFKNFKQLYKILIQKWRHIITYRHTAISVAMESLEESMDVFASLDDYNSILEQFESLNQIILIIIQQINALYKKDSSFLNIQQHNSFLQVPIKALEFMNSIKKDVKSYHLTYEFDTNDSLWEQNWIFEMDSEQRDELENECMEQNEEETEEVDTIFKRIVSKWIGSSAEEEEDKVDVSFEVDTTTQAASVQQEEKNQEEEAEQEAEEEEEEQFLFGVSAEEAKKYYVQRFVSDNQSNTTPTKKQRKI